MTQNRTQFSSWFVTDNERAKALVKSELKMTKNDLDRYNLWLEGFVDFWNKSDTNHRELGAVYYDWSIEQQQVALDNLANPTFAGLVNAIFFYKIHPDKLFADVIHPQKLISVQMRLGLLHYYIELMQQKLYEIAFQKGLTLGIDYFLHDEDLPQGIRVKTSEEYRQMIQSAVKRLKLNSNSTHVNGETIDYVSDLRKAYKFWFNPNRLIDAVMVLKQNLLSGGIEPEKGPILFQEKLVSLYSQLTTSECVDLYGYFANNDTQSLLYTFFNITHRGTFDWLPLLNNEEQAAVVEVFDALCSVMNALRIELGNRHFLTEPYTYDLADSNLEIDNRNRDAVYRVLKIYKHINTIHDDVIEQLFQSIEE
ncbi:hypothetical protein DGG96_06015 [Legionella qingyii]|uniref:Uncharacterized protein n=1 Tax=Legionella qingyii TaxID=2184757 RepID=A0A317U3S9_9GAMM|nr:hypothetical protein [Legionella qingyii]PWY56674.1 hypothetical protein DGG96_06015 [Legionella qingyii]RUR23487.1 hypothetical protein ELY20_07740 [Legionella qingyii]RUR26065.1 hypothetical protein ELY16_07935 [Legionella qingyii]